VSTSLDLPTERQSEPEQDSRSIAQIEADMEATRERLTHTVSELQTSVTPSALRRRLVDRVHGFYFDEYGGIRPERVALTAAAVVGLALLRRGD
jgi:hypothetical protein